MQASKFLFGLLSLIFSGLLFSCKEESKENIYELKDVQIRQERADKRFVKSDIEYISVVYSDLFEKTISVSQATALLNLYTASGDKQTIMDMVIRTLLNSPEARVPDLNSMKADPALFTEQTYKKFFLRNPTVYEKQYLTDLIKKDEKLTPALIYYTFLTSKEYKFY